MQEIHSTWYEVPKLNKIIQILAHQGQIQYKVLGGKKAAKVSQMMEEDQRKTQKQERQKFLASLQEFQDSLLKNLGYKKGKYAFLLGSNYDQQLNNAEYRQIEHLIDPSFLNTFDLIVQYSKDDSNADQMELILDAIFEQPGIHYHIIHWALIKYFTSNGRKLLYQIQTNECPQDITLNKQINMCKQWQQDVIAQISLNSLLQKYQVMSIIRLLITSLIRELLGLIGEKA